MWLYNKGKRKGDVLELFQIPLSEIPIIRTEAKIENEIAQIAKDITDLKIADKSTDTSFLEKKIDDLLYGSYDLSLEEINAIEKLYDNNKQKSE